MPKVAVYKILQGIPLPILWTYGYMEDRILELAIIFIYLLIRKLSKKF